MFIQIKWLNLVVNVNTYIWKYLCDDYNMSFLQIFIVFRVAIIQVICDYSMNITFLENEQVIKGIDNPFLEVE